jgi:hypothetical protein
VEETRVGDEQAAWVEVVPVMQTVVGSGSGGDVDVKVCTHSALLDGATIAAPPWRAHSPRQC